MLTEYAVIFSAVALPLTYVPILLVANDREYMGAHANGRLANVLGFVYLVVILVIAVAAIPLMIITNVGAELMTQIHIGRNVLDHQLLDRDGRRCGNVDDLAIEGGRGAPKSSRSSSGPGYWPQRAGWLGRLAGRLGGSGRVRVPWDEVTKVDSAVQLRAHGGGVGLGKGDDRLRPFLERDSRERTGEDASPPSSGARSRPSPGSRSAAVTTCAAS